MKSSKKHTKQSILLKVSPKSIFFFCWIFLLLIASFILVMRYRQAQIDADIMTWKTYTTPGVSFSIMYPPDWTIQEQKSTETNNVVSVNMTNIKSGSIAITWNTEKPLGIDCTTQQKVIKTKGGTVNCCQDSCPENAQTWSISKKLTKSPYYLYIRSYTSSNNPASEAIILRMLSTLSMQ